MVTIQMFGAEEKDDNDEECRCDVCCGCCCGWVSDATNEPVQSLPSDDVLLPELQLAFVEF
jgi:hypothetical protein